MIKPRLFAELCCGSAAVTLRLLGGPKARPPVSYQGSKRGYAHAILGALGLKEGVGANAVLLCDPGPWSDVWVILGDPTSRAQVIESLRSWIGEEPRTLWKRLRASGPLSGSSGAAQFLMLLSSNRLIHADWIDGSWSNTGKGGTTFGGQEFATPVDRVIMNISALESIRWPTSTQIVPASATHVDPTDVAAWLLLTHWSFSERGPDHGYGELGCEVWTTKATWTTEARDRSLERPKLIERIASLPALPPGGVSQDAREIIPESLPPGCYVYIDPPYEGTTPYRHDLPRADVLELARRWQEAGATVCLSEAEPLPLPGWYHLDITDQRKGQKRTFSKQQQEWLTLSQQPVTVFIEKKEPTNMMHLTKIKGTVKHGVEAELGEKTLIVGEPQEGKSEIVNAIEILLAGGASDVAGRPWVADYKMLYRHLRTHGGDVLHVEGEFSDGTGARWHSDGGKPDHDLPAALKGAVILPLREIREALTGSDEKAHRALVQWACKGVRVEDIEARIPGALHPLFWTLAGTDAKSCHDPIAALLQVREAAAKKSRDFAKEAKGAAAAVSAMGSGSAGAPATADQITEHRAKVQGYQQRLAELQSKRVQISTPPAGTPDRASLEALVASKRQALVEAMRIKKQAEEVLRTVAPPTIEDNRSDASTHRLHALRMLMEWQKSQMASGTCECVVCGQQADPRAFATRLAQFAEYLAGFEAGRAERHAVLMKRDNAAQWLQEEMPKFAATYEWIASIERTLAALDAPAAPIDMSALDKEIEIALSTLQSAQAYLTALERSTVMFEQSQKVRETQMTLDDQAHRASQLAEVCDATAKSLVAAKVGEFQAKVQKYMPEGETFGVELEPFGYGIVRNGVLDTALSGWETAVVLCAIGAALAEGSSLVVLIPGDHGTSPKHLRRLMEALRKAPGQIILTSTVAPERGKVQGWTILTRGEPTKPKRKKGDAEGIDNTPLAVFPTSIESNLADDLPSEPEALQAVMADDGRRYEPSVLELRPGQWRAYVNGNAIAHGMAFPTREAAEIEARSAASQAAILESAPQDTSPTVLRFD